MPGVVRRSRSIGSPHPLLGFQRGKIQSFVLLAASVQLGGVNESQTVTITGTPTGGNFTLTFGGQTTANIAFNATKDAVEDALELLSTIGAGNVRVTGGPAPGTPFVVTFVNDLDRRDVAQMTAAHTFTGGTTPAIAVTTTTPGDATDANRLLVKRGTILTKVPGNTSKVRRYTAQGGEAIVGVLARDVELFDQSAASDVDVNAFVGPGVTWNQDGIVDYALYGVGGSVNTAFATWAAARATVIGQQA